MEIPIFRGNTDISPEGEKTLSLKIRLIVAVIAFVVAVPLVSMSLVYIRRKHMFIIDVQWLVLLLGTNYLWQVLRFLITEVIISRQN